MISIVKLFEYKRWTPTQKKVAGTLGGLQGLGLVGQHHYAKTAKQAVGQDALNREHMANVYQNIKPTQIARNLFSGFLPGQG